MSFAARNDRVFDNDFRKQVRIGMISICRSRAVGPDVAEASYARQVLASPDSFLDRFALVIVTNPSIGFTIDGGGAVLDSEVEAAAGEVLSILSTVPA